MINKRNVYGEGNYEASRQYNDATKKFVESGRVDAAARAAAPRTPEEDVEMKQAELAALLHARPKATNRAHEKIGHSQEDTVIHAPRPDTGPDSP